MAVVMMGIFIILFMISFTFQSSGVVKTHTTAAFFPRVVLVLAMFLTLIMIIQAIRLKEDESKKMRLDQAAFKRVMLSMAAAIGFGFGASYLGTLVSIVLFITATMLVWGVRRKLTITLTALLTPVFIYLIFTKILLVQLPAGILM